MTDHWDFYFLHIDEHPASIYVDLGMESQAPLAALPHLALLRLPMLRPRGDGLSSREEFNTLSAIEDALTAQVQGDDAGYVGRNTCEGHRDFFFYVADPAAWAKRVDHVMAQYPDYQGRTSTREEADWSTYFNVLLPGPANRQSMENRQVCERLEELGDPLTAARQLDHWSYFPDEASARAFIEEAQSLGFSLTEGPLQAEDGGAFSVQLARTDIPSFQGIDAVTLPLFEASLRHGGDYDGWACHVEK
ncbi:DUF695 domain-containing protein [Roseateles sp. SL47]|uniref:DUF695 domain-containing protein n=1 Tax=Roseateles sp. SL47 TaxID=2995138 RepID=UPI002271122E|nr:DUF695 domain-containing protein [Roseateles sp. SL47]WAC73345.1 DUF695 domain-containing protein [Roseateles sp. SL47]